MIQNWCKYHHITWQCHLCRTSLANLFIVSFTTVSLPMSLEVRDCLEALHSHLLEYVGTPKKEQKFPLQRNARWVHLWSTYYTPIFQALFFILTFLTDCIVLISENLDAIGLLLTPTYMMLSGDFFDFFIFFPLVVWVLCVRIFQYRSTRNWRWANILLLKPYEF